MNRKIIPDAHLTHPCDLLWPRIWRLYLHLELSPQRLDSLVNFGFHSLHFFIWSMPVSAAAATSQKSNSSIEDKCGKVACGAAQLSHAAQAPPVQNSGDTKLSI